MMLALLFPLDGFLLYLLWRCLLQGRDWRESILAAFVTMGVIISVSTEVLGAFHAITGIAIRALWLAILLISLLLLFWQRAKIFIQHSTVKIGGRFAWTVFFIISFYLLVTLFIALYAPPNTNDSLGYHMSRVMHWIVDRSVAFYATPIDRQLWMPPFAEYSILHLFLLAGSDRFVNLVQWFSMAGSVIAVTLIAGQIGVKPRGQWFAALFIVTLPMGILQSTSTQTDYIVGFWSLCVFYYVLTECRRYISGGKAGLSLNTIFLGFSFSLAVFTKGTVYVVVFTMFLFLLIVLIWKHLWKVLAAMALLGVVCVCMLNTALWLRNYSIYRSILGPIDSITSSGYDPRLIISTALKDATNQLALPVGPGNKVMLLVVNKIHEIMGININDPRSSLNEYRIRFSTHEDFAGNPGQFLFWILSVLLISLLSIGGLFYAHLRHGSVLKKMVDDFPRPSFLVISYTLILITGYFLFALLFKWQSYNSRLLLPWMIAIGPLAGWVSDAIRPRFVFGLLALLFVIAGFRYLLANPSRPLISVAENKSILLASRTEVQFYNSPEIRDGLISVIVAAKSYDCGSIGLELDPGTPEYLIWYLLAANHEPVDQVENISSTLETNKWIDVTYRPCVIICNECTVAEEMGYQKIYNRDLFQLYVSPHRK